MTDLFKGRRPPPAVRQPQHLPSSLPGWVQDRAHVYIYTPYRLVARASRAPAPPLVVDRVSACRFTYSPGSSTRAALVTATLTVTEAGESVTLLQQAHVQNQP